MNTVDIPVGTKVYVNWYGHVVPVEVIDRKGHCDWPPFAEWIPVRMEIPGSDGKPIAPGCKNISMFHKHSVYETPEEAKEAWDKYQEQWQKRRTTVEAPRLPTPVEEQHADVVPSPGEVVSLEVAKARYLQFKADNWDNEHNHLKVSALDEFYGLWRTCIALKLGQQTSLPVASAVTEKEPEPEAVDDTPAVEPQQTDIIQPATDMPKPSKDIPKPTKKQLRSTGRIQYRDSIQTSLFE